MEVDLEVGFYLKPKLEEMQHAFEVVMQNVIETMLGISMWGKRAKTIKRNALKPVKGKCTISFMLIITLCCD